MSVTDSSTKIFQSAEVPTTIADVDCERHCIMRMLYN